MAAHRPAGAGRAEAHAWRRRIIELSGDCASSEDRRAIATGPVAPPSQRTCLCMTGIGEPSRILIN
jgi:hypothetical protein